MKKKTIAAIITLVALPVFGTTGVYAAGDGGADAGNGGADLPNSVKQEFANGKSAVYSGRYDKAIQHLKEVVTREPRNVDAYNYLGFSYRKTGNLELAAASYRLVFSIDPNHKGALEYQGELFLILGDLSAAQRNLARLEKLCPTTCKELAELKRAIADFTATRVSSLGG